MQKIKFLCILTALLALASCDEVSKVDVGPEIKIPELSKEIFTSGVNFEAAVSSQGLSKTVQFTATDKWSVEVSDTKASSWVTVVPTSGDAGDITLSVTAEPNPEYSERAAIVTINCGPVKTSFSVRQAAKTAIPVSSITLDKTELNLMTGENARLSATVNPDNATDKTVTWTSSDPKVVTVKDGAVTAVAAGFATIAVQAGDKTATCTVTVTDPVVEVSGITLDKATLNMLTGDSETLTATVSPENASVKTVSWTSSDPKVAYVSAGTVRAISAGTATITAQAGDKTATCEVTVTDPVVEVASVSLDKTTLNMSTGERVTLTATISPDNATTKTVSWSSSNTAVATVNNGIVSATGAGTATITAEAEGKTATCEVTVKDPVIEVTSLTLSKTETELEVGQEDYILARISPNDATDKTVTWSTSNKAVATVADGIIQAVSAGTATITATSANGLTAECKVTVVAPVTPPAPAIEVSSVSINKDTLKLEISGSETLTATVLPSDATDPSVTWTSTDVNIATVSSAGSVSAIAAGSAYVIAQAGEQKDTCVVVVTAPSLVPTSIELNKTTLGLTLNGTYTLTATVGPATAEDKSVTWESDAPTTVSVTSGGLVKGLALGNATITATTVNGLTATCKVQVISSSVTPGSPDPFNPEENW